MEHGREESARHPALVDVNKDRSAPLTNEAFVAILRALGYALLAAVVILNARFLVADDTYRASVVAGAAAAYGLCAAAAGVFLHRRLQPLDTSFALLACDVLALGWVVHATGGPDSRFVLILVLPVAAAVPDSFRRVLFLAHLSLGAFVLVIVIAASAERSLGNIEQHGAKLLILHGVNIYLALVALYVERRRRRSIAGFRDARRAQRRLEERIGELEEARRTAEEVSRYRSELLATASHEMRTPLNGILGLTRSALRSDMQPEHRRVVESVQESAEWLLQIVDGILDLARIEARGLDLSPVHFDLHDRLRDILEPLGVLARQKNLELTCEVPSDVPVKVIGDDGKLRQILENLLANALKFTERGHVALSVTVQSRSIHDVLLHFAVGDSGPGVPQERQQRMFQAFVQGRGPRRSIGVGLGLSIATRLTEAMGGRLWMDSDGHSGSTFHFTARFWLQRVVSSSVRPLLAPGRHPFRALLVEDAESSVRVLRNMLQEWSFEATVADDALSALDMAAAMRSIGSRFDVILVDAALGGESGFLLAESLQQAGDRAIVMLLASAGDFAEAARCRELRLARVTKPVMRTELAQAITTAMSGLISEPSAVSGDELPLRRHSRSLNVLVADDDPVGRALTAGLLQGWGHRVRTTGSALAAIEATESETFDLLLVDQHLPDAEGSEVIAEIRRRSDGGARAPEMLIVTADLSEGVAKRLRDSAVSIVTKPIDEDLLFDLVTGLTDSIDEREEASRARIREVVEHAGGNLSLARRISRLFFEESPLLLAGIREAIDRNDPERVARLSHKLKGSVSNFASEDAVDAALRLERLAGSGSLLGAEELYGSLAQAIESLFRALRPLVDVSVEQTELPDAGDH